jgi:hypothetical protein
MAHIVIPFDKMMTDTNNKNQLRIANAEINRQIAFRTSGMDLSGITEISNDLNSRCAYPKKQQKVRRTDNEKSNIF